MRAAVVTCHLQHSGKCQCSTRHAENVSLGEVRAPAAISRDDRGELDFKGKCGAPQEHDGDDVEVERHSVGGAGGLGCCCSSLAVRGVSTLTRWLT